MFAVGTEVSTPLYQTVLQKPNVSETNRNILQLVLVLITIMSVFERQYPAVYSSRIETSAHSFIVPTVNSPDVLFGLALRGCW